MKTADNKHTTNYVDTLIEVAEDCKVVAGTIPTAKDDKKTIALMQFELLANNPYKYTSDEILFQVYAHRNDLSPREYEVAKQVFFSKGQPCFRASPLTKQFGWGVHCDKDAKVAIYGIETEQYQRLLNDAEIKKVKAMRNSKKMNE